MAHAVYSTSAWRTLPRTGNCVLADLLPDSCHGQLHRHHVHPVTAGGDPLGSTVLVCAHHHPTLEAMARAALGWKACPHRPGTHRYPGAKDECERRLNSV